MVRKCHDTWFVAAYRWMRARQARGAQKQPVYKQASREGGAAGFYVVLLGPGLLSVWEAIQETSSGVSETLGLGEGQYFSVGQG